MKEILIDGVVFIPKDRSIEEVHKKNMKFIKENNLKEGSFIVTAKKRCDKLNLLKITHIHSLYGWIEAENKKHSLYGCIPIENIVCCF